MEVKDILEERQETHGEFSEGAKFTQVYKQSIRQTEGWLQLSYSKKESIDMVIHKLARICVGDFKWLDSWYDVIGYSQLIINQEKENNKEVIPAVIPFFIESSIIPLIYKTIIESIITELFTAVINPSSIKPWQNVIEFAQFIIDDLESKGEKRVQR